MCSEVLSVIGIVALAFLAIYLFTRVLNFLERIRGMEIDIKILRDGVNGSRDNHFTTMRMINTLEGELHKLKHKEKRK